MKWSSLSVRSAGTKNRPPIYRSISTKSSSWTSESRATITASVECTFRSNRDKSRQNSSLTRSELQSAVTQRYNGQITTLQSTAVETYRAVLLHGSQTACWQGFSLTVHIWLTCSGSQSAYRWSKPNHLAREHWRERTRLYPSYERWLRKWDLVCAFRRQHTCLKFQKL